MTVLAGVDGSRYQDSVCDYAARAARYLGTGVALLHVIDPRLALHDPIDRSGAMTVDLTDTALAEFTQVHEAQNRLAQQRGRALLDRAATAIRAAGIATVQARLVFGELVDHLHDADPEVRLIVLGQRGAAEHAATGHLGTNVERIVRASVHPVLIVPAAPRALRRILVAYDGGPSASTIIDVLARAPLPGAAECILLTVGESPRQREALARAASQLRASGYQVTELLTPGHADTVILETMRTRDADLLIMGAYGHSRIRALMIGSTTTVVLRESPIPVLVYRARQ